MLVPANTLKERLYFSVLRWIGATRADASALVLRLGYCNGGNPAAHGPAECAHKPGHTEAPLGKLQRGPPRGRVARRNVRS